jgi:outer membrane protein assembly factor BamD (BamD/ComL family)
MKRTLCCTGLFLALIFFVTSCQSVPKNIPQDLTADELVNFAQSSYDDGNVKAAQAYYEAIIIRYGDQMDKLVEAEYEIAHLKIKQKKWQQAIPDLQRILSYYEADATGILPPAFKKLAELDLAKVPEKELLEAEERLLVN